MKEGAIEFANIFDNFTGTYISVNKKNFEKYKKRYAKKGNYRIRLVKYLKKPSFYHVKGIIDVFNQETNLFGLLPKEKWKIKP